MNTVRNQTFGQKAQGWWKASFWWKLFTGIILAFAVAIIASLIGWVISWKIFQDLPENITTWLSGLRKNLMGTFEKFSKP